MLRTLLVPFDSSLQAEKALPVAARLARSAQGKVVLVRAVSQTTEYWPAVMAPSPLAQIAVEGEVEDAEQYLRQIAASPLFAGIPTETVVQFGPAAPAILAVAAAHRVDLIVMGNPRFTGVTYWMPDSVAEKVIRHAPAPVLVWRAETALPQKNSFVESPLRFLVPQDGMLFAEAALEPAVELLLALKDSAQKGALHPARIVQSSTRDRQDDGAHAGYAHRDLEGAKHLLRQMAERINEGHLAPHAAENHLRVSWSVALDRNVAEALVRMAENGEDGAGLSSFGGCALIALATHGRRGLQHWTMGSITERILHTTRLPLLVVPPSCAAWRRSDTYGERKVEAFM